MTRTVRSIVFSVSTLVVIVLGLSLFYLYMRVNGDYYSYRDSSMECVIAGVKEFCTEEDYRYELEYYKITASDLRKHEKYLEEWKKTTYDHPWVDFSGRRIVFTDYFTASSWTTYQNEESGFEFKYPKEWSVPQMIVGRHTGGGSYPAEESVWRLYIGEKTSDACEGEDCYELYFDAYGAKSIADIRKNLQEDQLIRLTSEHKISGGAILVYEEGGICGSKKALILEGTQMLKFTSHCGADDAELSKTFDQILATFKLTR